MKQYIQKGGITEGWPYYDLTKPIFKIIDEGGDSVYFTEVQLIELQKQIKSILIEKDG